MKATIKSIIRTLLDRPNPDPINNGPTEKEMGMTSQHIEKEEDYYRVLPRGRYGFRNVYPDGSRDYTVIF